MFWIRGFVAEKFEFEDLSNAFVVFAIDIIDKTYCQTARAHSRGQKKKKMLYEVCELTLCHGDIIKNRYSAFY